MRTGIILTLLMGIGEILVWLMGTGIIFSWLPEVWYNTNGVDGELV